MTKIHTHKTELKKIIDMIKTMLHVDAAIFDLDSQLLAATDEYLEQKGNTVHAPSIQEAVANGNVMVNKPGHMPACDGCRFIGNCPAKIEILKSIQTDTTTLGVMTFTSFTREGHDKITRETRAYVEALNLFSGWVADLVTDRDAARILTETDQVLNTLMDLTQDAILTIDTRGMVTRGNARALKLFSFCDLYTRSAFHILPDPVVDKILDHNHLKATLVRINGKDAYVSAGPVYIDDQFTGAVLTLSQTLKTEDVRPGPLDRLRSTPIGLKDILGKSPDIVRVKRMAKRLAPSVSTILITGKTGTGKGLLAKAIHASGTRKDAPFVPVNCASIPDTLFESELFGYDEGAFTGAKKGGKPGRFELAHQGTLFLDEIGEMPLHLQAKLLNVLQDLSLQRVGGITTIPVDVRVIAATNQDIETLVREKKFRSDLFYRLNVIPMDLPPLAQRKSDIPILCDTFLKLANHKAGKQVKSLSPEVMDRFHNHDWPGNIRELQNLIEYSVNMTRDPVITPRDLPDRFLNKSDGAHAGSDPEPNTSIKQKSLAAQTDAIQNCLDQYGHDLQGKKKTAEKLGISIRTLYRKLKTP